jgi:carbon starvation protein
VTGYLEDAVLALILVFSCVCFVLAYFLYGRFLDRRFCIDNCRPTPAQTMPDGVDYVPARAPVLLGHHFSSISGAGPIVGPIIAGIAFGWVPVLIWVVLGSIFVGGVHDYAALTASIRHQGRSIADVASEELSPLARRLFLAFVWLALVYILVVFIDLTSLTFKQDGGVASSSVIYIVLAVVFGLAIHRLGLRLGVATAIFVPLVFLGIYLGQRTPLDPGGFRFFFEDPRKTWSVILVGYCFVASVTPVWALLQPRDYLSSFLLYASVLAGFLGLLLGGIPQRYPAFVAWSGEGVGTLFPFLFITVACGAVSGFHSLVASGTSSKQLSCEKDARRIGYGSMLLEGVVAVIAMCAVMMVGRGDPSLKQQPLAIFAAAMGRFFEAIRLPGELGQHFGFLAVSTFILTTLDTATRIGRYVLQELFGWRGGSGRAVATVVTLALPALFVLITLRDATGNPIPAWRLIWPVFGATNQLLATLALLVIFAWLGRLAQPRRFVMIPTLLMIGVTLAALGILVTRFGHRPVGIAAVVLFLLALVLIWEAARVVLRAKKRPRRS